MLSGFQSYYIKMRSNQKCNTEAGGDGYATKGHDW